MTGALAAGLGPALGGGLVQLSWQWAFWINLPIGLVLVVGALRYVPDLRLNLGTPFPDLVGAVVLTVTVGGLVLGVVQGNGWGWNSPRVIGAIGVAVLGAAVFARRTLRHHAPIIAPALLAVPAFRWANAATLVFNTGFGASLLGAILWLQQVWGNEALQTGLAIAVGPLLVPTTSIVARRFLPRAKPGLMISADSLVFALAAWWQGSVLGSTPAYWTEFLPAWLLAGVGVGLAMPNLVAAATSHLPPEYASTGGGVVNMARQVGLALGVSMLVAILGSPESVTGFTRAWHVVAITMIVAALIAARIDRAAAKASTRRSPTNSGAWPVGGRP
jgi:MFS family permease